MKLLDIPKIELIKMYIVKRISLRQCAKFYNCDATSISNHLKRYGVKRRTIGEANQGRKPWSKGIKFSKKYREKLREAHLGLKAWNKGLTFLDDSRIKVGIEHHLWKGGNVDLKINIRNSVTYKLWREAVFQRDNFICQKCKIKGYIEAHHIKAFYIILEENNIKTMEQALKTESLWDVNNGITLCLDCHNNMHRRGWTLRKSQMRMST